MTALALAVVLVSLVVRDVALRVLADRARERGIARGDIEQARAALAAATAATDAVQQSTARMAELATRVERIEAREALKGLVSR